VAYQKNQFIQWFVIAGLLGGCSGELGATDDADDQRAGGADPSELDGEADDPGSSGDDAERAPGDDDPSSQGEPGSAGDSDPNDPDNPADPNDLDSPADPNAPSNPDEQSSPSPDQSSGGATDQPVVCSDDLVQIGSAPMRRLSSREYLNTLSDLFPSIRPELPILPIEDPVDSFDNDARALGASDVHVSRWEEIAFRYTSDLTTNQNALTSFLPCSADATNDTAAQACGRELVEKFGQATHRRPLTSEEQARYQGLFEEQLAAIDFEAAVQITAMAMLQSPWFLYRLEPTSPDASDSVTPLDDWEMASRLSYFFWQRTPDDELFAAAASGSLTDEADVESQARRMAADPRAREAVADFHRQWLFFDRIFREEHDTRVPDLFPNWSAASQAPAHEEMLRFVGRTVFDGGGTLSDLLLSRETEVDPSLASIYGVEGPNDEGQWATVTLPEGERAGILTRVGFLAAHAHSANGSPPLRGAYVMARMFCLPPVSPPPDADTSPPELMGQALTNRELFEERTTPVACQGCHTVIDGFGFGFENYDAIGAYRTTDNGRPVNAVTTLVGTDVNGDVDGAVELSQQLAQSDQVAACAVSRWFRYSRGRSLEGVDECVLDRLNARFSETGGNIIELMIDLASSPEFRYRPAGQE
jgi:hypothetical protein